jgi:hypothetical protein
MKFIRKCKMEVKIFIRNQDVLEAFSWLRHYTTSRKVAGLIPDVIGFFNCPNFSSCTIAVGSTQPMTEMSTRNLPGTKGRLVHEADNLTAICEPVVWKIWERRLTTLWASMACYRDSVTFFITLKIESVLKTHIETRNRNNTKTNVHRIRSTQHTLKEKRKQS